MSCYRTSNNKHFTAPPRMADGRHFTDYRPSCDVNNMIRADNNLKSSFEYRLFLTNNAEKLIDVNKKHAFIKNGVNDCKPPFAQGTMLPEQNMTRCDNQVCNLIENDKNGLGLGRIYSDKPNEVLDSLKVPELKLDENNCATPEDKFSYLPIDEKQEDNVQRNSIRGGDILEGGDVVEEEEEY